MINARNLLIILIMLLNSNQNSFASDLAVHPSSSSYLQYFRDLSNEIDPELFFRVIQNPQPLISASLHIGEGLAHLTSHPSYAFFVVSYGAKQFLDSFKAAQAQGDLQSALQDLSAKMQLEIKQVQSLRKEIEQAREYNSGALRGVKRAKRIVRDGEFLCTDAMQALYTIIDQVESDSLQLINENALFIKELEKILNAYQEVLGNLTQLLHDNMIESSACVQQATEILESLNGFKQSFASIKTKAEKQNELIEKITSYSRNLADVVAYIEKIRDSLQQVNGELCKVSEDLALTQTTLTSTQGNLTIIERLSNEIGDELSQAERSSQFYISVQGAFAGFLVASFVTPAITCTVGAFCPPLALMATGAVAVGSGFAMDQRIPQTFVRNTMIYANDYLTGTNSSLQKRSKVEGLKFENITIFQEFDSQSSGTFTHCMAFLSNLVNRTRGLAVVDTPISQSKGNVVVQVKVRSLNKPLLFTLPFDLTASKPTRTKDWNKLSLALDTMVSRSDISKKGVLAAYLVLYNYSFIDRKYRQVFLAKGMEATVAAIANTFINKHFSGSDFGENCRSLFLQGPTSFGRFAREDDDLGDVLVIDSEVDYGESSQFLMLNCEPV